jgi:hypothetical protein
VTTYGLRTESTTTIGGRTAPVDLLAAVWAGVPRIVSRRIPPAISREQAYYWSAVWQRGEQEALADLDAGRFRTFADPGEAVRWLLSAEE